MELVALIAYVVVGLVLAIVVGRVVVTLFAMLRPGERRFIARSGVDRRKRQLPVTVERRRGPRRQDDIATTFLATIDRPRHRPAVGE